MKLKFIITCLIIYSSLNAQFLDFNLFKARYEMSSELSFKSTKDSLSSGFQNHSISAFIPLKNKFSVDLDWQNIFKSKGLKDAFLKTVNPKFYQIFGKIGGGYRRIESNFMNSTPELAHFNAGITGIKLQMKSGKFRFMYYNVSVNLAEEFTKYSVVKPSLESVLAGIRLFDYRTAVFYGVYANYYNGRFLPLPLVGFYYKTSWNSSFTVLLPAQINYSTAILDKVRQTFAVSYFTLNNGVQNNQLFINRDTRINFAQTNLRLSSQTRFKFGKGAFLYLEGGWQFYKQDFFSEGYDTYQVNKQKSSPFVKASLSFTFGKALFNPSVFQF